MAFSTIQGSGGAPDSFVGTTGVDALAVANSDGNFFVGANAGNDNIIISNTGAPLYSGVLSTSTVKAGDGRDTLTIGTAGNVTTFTNLFVNGNGDRDTITFLAADTVLASTIKGGAANDTITTGIVTSALVNGNKGVDTVTVGAAATASSVHGGGGADIITTASNFTNGLMSGDLGDDRITITGGNTLDGSTVAGGEGADNINLAAAGDAADEDLLVEGGAGVDIITGPIAGTTSTLNGGEGGDTLSMSGAVGANATSTLIGGAGSDTINLASGTGTVLYSAASDFGAFGSAASGAVAANGDTITGFNTTVDEIAVGNIISGVGAVAANQGLAAGVNFNTNGVVVTSANATALTFNLATGTYADLEAVVTQATGNVTGDAGDTGIVSLLDGGGNILNVAVTLGTAAAGGRAIDNTDSLAIISTLNAVAVAGDFSFATA